jgi:hypothetical protein
VSSSDDLEASRMNAFDRMVKCVYDESSNANGDASLCRVSAMSRANLQPSSFAVLVETVASGDC